MHWIDRLEKAGRLILWLALATLCLAGLTQYWLQQVQTDRVAQAVRQADEKLQAALAANKDTEPRRITLASMGPYMHSIVTSTGQVHVWVTNLLPEGGFVCAMGKVASEATGKATTGLPACQEMKPFDSNVRMTLQFASAQMTEVCEKDDCELTLSEAPGSWSSETAHTAATP